MPLLRPVSLALFVLTLSAQAQQSLTAEQVIAKMREAAGVTAVPNTVDTIKAGDPATVVTGIATVIAPSMDVLRKAVAAHENLIITHEPTFYNHQDADTLFKNDPVYAEKMAYIREHGLVIFRWHDGWHARKPDGIAEGWTKKAGWKQFQNADNQYLYTIPTTTVKALAQQLQASMGNRIVRVVGDPNMKVSKAAYAPGASGEARQIQALEREDVEVLIAGEIPEWETISYVWDAQQQGRHKAMILLGHYTSEEPGMDNCATWLKTVFHDTKIDFIPAGEPYWLSGNARNR
ncbi:Nif3-like dinuclear metal center hexameric protein [Terriglobus roseus]|uniref:Putative GTP cyclohydrolase 1 type 2, NIF3 family n=1 Tax=Terriglobus roseus TaxID=392734 RepID=A0A1H4PFN0_9BACT|nr:Nif3-like dinuclear metal center hexameric protein [Terriglobus roseus]SEC06225.1 Putative GTP cyclohydrolase 1 type 2, NIF3 family [Terriglobus roseus]